MDESARKRYRDIFGVTNDPLVSSHIIQDSRVSITDLDMARVVDSDPVDILSWYGKEWGLMNQTVRQALQPV